MRKQVKGKRRIITALASFISMLNMKTKILGWLGIKFTLSDRTKVILLAKIHASVLEMEEIKDQHFQALVGALYVHKLTLQSYF